MTPADYAGIVTVISSVTTAVVAVIVAVRQSSNKTDTDGKLEALHVQGNSNMETTRQMAESLGMEKGKAIGAVQERANPMEPKKV